MCGNYTCIYKPPVEKMGPARKAIWTRHANQMEKDYRKSIVQTLYRFFDNVSLSYNDKGYIENVGEHGSLSVALSSQIECHGTEKLRRVRSQSCD